ncbi:hypothetical protein O3P69_014479 [Scylla paramamosain]|uniref:Transposase n=1 Tax=Scylla paramamosain TaxID=85552 RepID=A0AAW0TCD9_SCYPA
MTSYNQPHSTPEPDNTELSAAGQDQNGHVPRTMTRYPFQPTNLSERMTFVSLWVKGRSTRSIARETGVSPSTVYRWINRWKQNGNVYNQASSSRPCHTKRAKQQVLGSLPQMLVIALLVWLFFLASHSQHSGAQMSYSSELSEAEALGAVQAVISSHHQQECPVLLVLNHPRQELNTVMALRGVTVFQVPAHNVTDNETQIHLEAAVGNIRQRAQRTAHEGRHMDTKRIMDPSL